MSVNPVKYRKDYQAPPFFIQKTQLEFDLYEEFATIRSQLTMQRNQESPDENLFLHGEALELISLILNDKKLSEQDYQITDAGLTIKSVPDEFVLQIETKVYPQNNTKLMGLYRTSGTFCTQCEAEGFRRITYYMDRPDVLSEFTTTIIADKGKYPQLLSNGNLIKQTDLADGRHQVVWHDPFKKPAYLFALVAGDLACIDDEFVTMSGRQVTLRIFANEKVVKRCHFAMESVKKAMRWDEETYQREYDLDIFMIVAVSDFNFGAMENKGLNIFNDKYILASGKTATDTDFAFIDAVVGHEYFHNWSGDRVTLRDWFQITLKEGLTVFREQSFSEAIGSRAIERINQVKRLRSMQFPEDDGPLAHPTRPESYIEMNNFYTMTVYEKGAEVIRMLKTILGDEAYFEGVNLYFKRHDGQAVSCDEFVQALQDVTDVDLTQFRLWYSQAGTPQVSLSSNYDNEANTWTLIASQLTQPTPGQAEKHPLHIPIEVALLNAKGEVMPIALEEGGENQASWVVNLTEAEQSFTFYHVKKQPTPSLMRNFSAPVRWRYEYSDEERALLLAHDRDPVARWDVAQQYFSSILLSLIKQYQDQAEFHVPDEFMRAIKALLSDQQADPALIALMLQLPSEIDLADRLDLIDVQAIFKARTFLKKHIAGSFTKPLSDLYEASQCECDYQYKQADVAKRALKNVCLDYLMTLKEEEFIELSYQQFKVANNMTDKISALSFLTHCSCKQRDKALQRFEKRFADDHLVMDKWFSAQAMSVLPTVFSDVRLLQEHSGFDLKNPNRVRSLVGAFVRGNFCQFHLGFEATYPWLTDLILELDEINPMVASRLIETFAHWKQFDGDRKSLMEAQLKQIQAKKELSKDSFEIVDKLLA